MYWYGAYDECLALPRNVSQYCMLRIPIAMQGAAMSLDIGLCVPPSCTDNVLPQALALGERFLLRYIQR